MKKVISGKLRSNEGVSLSIALLLFLICAIVASIILTAGTAASGRLSKKAELDQKYYLVNSVADLLIEELEGKTIIKEEKTGASVSVVYKDMNGNELKAGINDSLVFDLARGREDLSSVKTVFVNYTKDGANKTLYAYYDVTVGADGQVTIRIRDVQDADDPNAYTVKLLFSGDVSSSLDATNELKITRYRWFLKDIQKGK